MRTVKIVIRSSVDAIGWTNWTSEFPIVVISLERSWLFCSQPAGVEVRGGDNVENVLRWLWSWPTCSFTGNVVFVWYWVYPKRSSFQTWNCEEWLCAALVVVVWASANPWCRLGPSCFVAFVGGVQRASFSESGRPLCWPCLTLRWLFVLLVEVGVFSRDAFW